MALKRKITKAEFDALNPVIQAEYKGDGAGYVLDADNDDNAADDLRRALEHSRNDTAAERAAKKELSDKLAEIQRKIDEGILTTAEADNDIDKIKEIFINERETLRTSLTATIDAKDNTIRSLLLGGKAEAMAAKLGGPNAALLLPHITPRLSVDTSGAEPVLVVLAANGSPSTLSVEDLEQELLKNPIYAPILVGVDSSGGGATRNGGGGASGKKPEEYTSQERQELYRTNPELFHKTFPVKG